MSNDNGFGRLFMVGKNSHGQLGVQIQGKEIIYDIENFTSELLLMDYYNKISVVSCGPSHSGFIHDGKVFMFGDGSFGKLGNGSTEDKKSPTMVASVDKFVQLVAANEHTMALSETGQVWSWGSTTYGRLGAGELTYKVRVAPILVSTLAAINIKKIYACGAASAALTDTGLIYTWGINKNGQLGHGHNNDLFYPTLLSFFRGNPIKSISMGNRQMGCIDSQNNIYMWGLNDNYQLGDGTSFSKNSPQLIRVKMVKFQEIACGGDFTAAISGEEDNHSLYVWGGFVREYASSKPRKIFEQVKNVSCSIDCGKHLVFNTLSGACHSVGWSRYGQTTYEMDTLVVEESRMKTVVGRVHQTDCGAYHSALLFRKPEDYVMMLIKLGLKSQLEKEYNSFTDVLKYVNPNGDSLLHLLAQSKFEYNNMFSNTGPLINKLNNDEHPPFFYNSKVLKWFLHTKSTPNSNYQTSSLGDSCLHYYVKNNMIEDLEYALSTGLVNCNLRNKAKNRALEMLEDENSYEIKKRFKIYDIGIVGDSNCQSVINIITESLSSNHINSCVISPVNGKFSKDTSCIGYIFCITESSLSTSIYKDYLLNFISKQPMVSIWVEKQNIQDPSMESCIYRSQLVDFSSSSLYTNSLSVLLQGVHNMIDYIPSEDGESKQEEIKTDVDYNLSRSENPSIFISFDPSKAKEFQPLFNFFTSKGIEIISRDKGVLQSWLVIVILVQTDLSPLMRDEISLAENRNKLVIPIYYNSIIPLDKGLTYSFANSSQILFSDEGFNQLLLSTKLQFKLLKEQSKLLNIKNKLLELKS